jgi:hypothetical protein
MTNDKCQITNDIWFFVLAIPTNEKTGRGVSHRPVFFSVSPRDEKVLMKKVP